MLFLRAASFTISHIYLIALLPCFIFLIPIQVLKFSMKFPTLVFGVSRLHAISTLKFFMVRFFDPSKHWVSLTGFGLNFFGFATTMAKPSIEDNLNITPLRPSSAWIMEMTSLSFSFPRTWTRTWSNSTLSPIRNSKIHSLSTNFSSSLHFIWKLW